MRNKSCSVMIVFVLLATSFSIISFNTAADDANSSNSATNSSTNNMAILPNSIKQDGIDLTYPNIVSLNHTNVETISSIAKSDITPQKKIDSVEQNGIGVKLQTENASIDLRDNSKDIKGPMCDFDGDTSIYGYTGDASPTGETYLIFNDWGGTWCDAEKSPTNSEDDDLCWAAAASNILEWTEWGVVGGMSTSDDIFQHFQDHWTDVGGWPQYAWEWWFNGTSDAPGGSIVDVPGGGDFYPSKEAASYYLESWIASDAMMKIDEYLHAGYGVTLLIYGPGAHAITCWGYNHNTSNSSDYLGVWITDSDDDKGSLSPPDRLRYYEVVQSAGSWYLQDYYGSDSWYIWGVEALERRSGSDIKITNPFVGSYENGSITISGTASSIGNPETLLNEGFEGAWPNSWDCSDKNGVSGYDYWGDNSQRSRIGGWSAWCSDEGTTSSVLYSQNFNNGGFTPSGWTTSGAGPNYHSWNMRLDSGIDYRAEANSDEAGSGTDITEWLYMTTSFSTVSYTNISLQFYLDYHYYNGDEYAQVLYATSASYPTFYVLKTWNSNDVIGTQIVDLSVAAGNSQIHLAFRYHGTYDWYMRVDDVIVRGDAPSTFSYDNNMDSWMIRGPFDLSTAIDANLNFYYWLKSEANFDYLYWLASPDGVNFDGYRISGDQSGSGWQFISYDLSNYDGIGSSLLGDSSVWIAFRFTSDGSITYEGAYVDDVNLIATSSLTSVTISTDGGWSWNLTSGTTSWSYQWDTTLSSDGVHTIYAIAYYSYTTPFVWDSTWVIVDNSPPASLTIAINNYASWTNSTLVNLQLSCSDGNGSGLKDIRLSNDGSNWNPWETYSTSKVWTLQSGDGIKTVFFKARDFLNNEASAVWDTIVLDTTPPTGSLAINDNAAYCNTTSVTLKLMVNDALSGVALMRLSNDGGNWNPWEAYSTSKAWIVQSGIDTKTVYYQMKDNTGTVSIVYSDTIILDTTPPSGSIIINGGMQYTNSTSVTLDLSASDAISGVAQMRFSNDNTTWSAWQSYSASKTWILTTGDLTKGVFVQYINNAGLLSTVVTDTIILDTTEPNLAFERTDQFISNISNPIISWICSDATSGIKYSEYSIDGSNYTSTGMITSAILNDLSEGPHRINVRAVDYAGLFRETILQFIIDTIAPSTNTDIIGVVGANGSYTSAVSVILTGNTGSGSGMNFTMYRIDGGSWHTYTGVLKITTNGTHTIEYYSVDLAGNIETTKSDTIKIYMDNTPASVSPLAFSGLDLMLLLIAIGACMALLIVVLKRRKKDEGGRRSVQSPPPPSSK